jgi:molybdopterin-guanine dinucleotide biosynthesis protein B
MPYILGVSGFKNSGKTILCRKLVPLLEEGGIDVAYVKRTHENVVSPECSDSGSLSTVSAPVALWGADGFRIEERTESLDPYALAARFFQGKHLLLLEGGKNLNIPKVWVGSPTEVPEEVTGIVAFYDRDNPCERERHYASGQEEELASFIVSLVSRAEASPAEVYAGGRRIPVKFFVGDFIAGGLSGMLRALKGEFDPEAGVSVHLRETPGRGR